MSAFIDQKPPDEMNLPHSEINDNICTAENCSLVIFCMQYTIYINIFIHVFLVFEIEILQRECDIILKHIQDFFSTVYIIVGWWKYS